MTTAVEQLVRRLERMVVPPAPRDLAARAVAAARQPVARRRRLPARPAIAAAAALLVLGSAMAATWPASRRALDDFPALGSGPREVLGLLHAGNTPAAGQTSATSGGVTMRLKSVSDDGNLVVVTLEIRSADWRPAADGGAYAFATLTDASGRRLPMAPGPGGAEGDSVLVYSRPLNGPGAGSPLTLHADHVVLHQGGTTNDVVPGSWTLRFQARASSAPRDLPVPALMTAGPIRVTVTALRVSHSYLDVRFDVTGPAMQADYAGAELTFPDGMRAPMPYQWGDATPTDATDTTVRTSHHEEAFNVAGPGTYRLAFPVFGPGGMTLLVADIAIPHS